MARGDVITTLGLTGNPQVFQPASGVEWLITHVVTNTDGTILQMAGTAAEYRIDLGAGNTGNVHTPLLDVWSRNGKAGFFVTNTHYMQSSGTGTHGFHGVQTK